MSYQAKRSKKYIEEFELVDENGEVVHSLKVRLDADDLLKNINGQYLELVKAYDEAQKYKEAELSHEDAQKGLTALGNAMLNMMRAVFGKDDSNKIYEFYEGRYVEMTKEVSPFFFEIVVPRCREIINENKEAVKSKYNRKQRRGMFARAK